MNITFVTSAETDEKVMHLVKGIGLPFKNAKRLIDMAKESMKAS